MLHLFFCYSCPKKYYLKEQLEEVGLKTIPYEFENAGPLLIGKYGEGNQSEGIILAGHMDTVFKDGFILDHSFKVEGPENGMA